MNWDAVGAVAELVAATGVVASLFYLGIQIRQNTRSVRASSYHAVVANLSQQSSAASRDPSLVELVFRGQSDFSSLSRGEQMQFELFLVGLFRGYEDVFYQYRQGMLDESVWPGWSNSMTRLFWQPGVQTWWPTWRADCHLEFRDFLEKSAPPTMSMVPDILREAKSPTV